MNKIVETYHKQLLQYKDKHKGEVAYIFGTGPTLNYFEEQEKGVYIGGNHIIRSEIITKKLEYYFFGDAYVGNLYESDWDKYIPNKELKTNIDNLSDQIKKYV